MKQLKMTAKAWTVLTIARAQRRARATLRTYGGDLTAATVNAPEERKPRARRKPLVAFLAPFVFASSCWSVADSILDPAMASYTLDGQALACYAQDKLRYPDP